VEKQASPSNKAAELSHRFIKMDGDWMIWTFALIFVFTLAILVARCRQQKQAMLALKQQNGAYPTTNAYGQSNMYSGAPQPVYGQGLQAVHAAQGVQLQVPIPVAEAVPVSEQPGVAYATATPNKVETVRVSSTSYNIFNNTLW
jgi:hypothetical protein